MSKRLKYVRDQQSRRHKGDEQSQCLTVQENRVGTVPGDHQEDGPDQGLTLPVQRPRGRPRGTGRGRGRLRGQRLHMGAAGGMREGRTHTHRQKLLETHDDLCLGETLDAQDEGKLDSRSVAGPTKSCEVKKSGESHAQEMGTDHGNEVDVTIDGSVHVDVLENLESSTLNVQKRRGRGYPRGRGRFRGRGRGRGRKRTMERKRSLEETDGEPTKRSVRTKYKESEENYMELGKEMEEVKDEETTTVSVTPVSSRGRKRKKSTGDAKLDKVEDCTCTYCNEVFPPANMYKHVASKHNRLWSPDNPEGVFNPNAIYKHCGYVACNLCSRRLHSLQHYRYHTLRCGQEIVMADCKVCGRAVQTVNMRSHVRQHELRELYATPKLDKKNETELDSSTGRSKRRAAERARQSFKQPSRWMDEDEGGPMEALDNSDIDTDFKVEDAEDEGDMDEESSGGEQEDDAHLDDRRKGKSTVVKSKTPGLNSSYAVKSSGRKHNQSTASTYMVDEAYDWTYKWRKDNDSKTVFHEWLPRKSEWVKLNTREAEVYLPMCKQSPVFSILKGQKSMMSDITLNCFGARHGDAPCFFAGGQVWAAAWVPVPVAMVTTQYVAIYCHREQNATTSLFEPSSGPGLVQIWDCGAMQSRSLLLPPRVVLGMAHDFGCVNEMKWCHTGAWQYANDDIAAGYYRRLGLLAMACSDGKLRIFSIPHPQCLDAEEDSFPVFQAKPVAILQSNFEGLETAVCSTLDWQWADHHSKIAGGYSDGSVTLWDLTSQSILLRTKTNCGIDTFIPYHIFQAHASIVSSVAFCPRSPDILSTCSRDRLVKTWNKRNTSCPISYQSRNIFAKVYHPLHWPLVFSAGDDCYSYEHNGMICLDSGYIGIYVRLLSIHNAAIWDLDFSEWLNAVVSVDNAGQVMVMSLPALKGSSRPVKAFTHRRFHLTNTYLQKLNNGLDTTKHSKVLDKTPSSNSTDKNDHQACTNSVARVLFKNSTVHAHADVLASAHLNSNERQDLDSVASDAQATSSAGTSVVVDSLTECSASTTSDRTETSNSGNGCGTEVQRKFASVTDTDCPARKISTLREQLDVRWPKKTSGNVDDDTLSANPAEPNSCAASNVQSSPSASKEADTNKSEEIELNVNSDSTSAKSVENSSSVQQLQSLQSMAATHRIVYEDSGKIDHIQKHVGKLGFPSSIPGDDRLDQPSLRAATVSRWNPNLGSHVWLLLAGRSGIIRLVHVSGYQTKYGTKFTRDRLFTEESTTR